MNDFQYRLLKVIAERNVTAADLVRATGIDKGAISNYINGAYIPKQDKAYKLARALGVDPGWLITGIEQENVVLSQTERDIILSYRQSNETTQEIIRNILKIKEETP